MSVFLRYIGLFVLLFSSALCAQQEWMYSQYIFNPYDANMGFAGQYDKVSTNLRIRQQWSGLEGAPQSLHFSIHSPLRNRKVALGLAVQAESIGLRSQNSALGSFSYRVYTRKGYFAGSLGLGVLQQRFNTSDAELPSGLPLNLQTDNWLAFSSRVGLLYQGKRFYAGAQINRLAGGSYSWYAGSLASQAQHFTAMASYAHPLGKTFALRPSALLRSDLIAPSMLETSLAVSYQQRYWLGAGYRTTGEAFALLEASFGEHFRFGYSYDFPTGLLQSSVQQGSHELFLGFNINPSWSEPASIRYF